MTKTYRKLSVFTKTTNFAEAVKVVEVPLEEPSSDRIRVKQLYAGVNATDINITAARYATDGDVPFDIGLEAVGVVDAIGSEVKTDLKIGQSVLVFGSDRKNGFSEYSYNKPEALKPVPSADPKYLVTLINGLTASIALDESGRIKASDTVLITAASGGTGQIAVQWAKKRGSKVIALTSSEKKAEYLRSLGADFVVNYRETPIDKWLDENFPNGVDVVWETIGGDIFCQLANRLSTRGRLIIIGSIHSYKEVGFKYVPIENLNAKLLKGSKTLTGFFLFNYFSEIPQYLPKLITDVADGTIKAAVDLGETSPDGPFVGVEQIARAEEWLHSGKNLGKVVVKLQN